MAWHKESKRHSEVQKKSSRFKGAVADAEKVSATMPKIVYVDRVVYREPFHPADKDAEMTEYKGYKIYISQDQDPQSPREDSNLGIIVSWHRNYDFNDKNERKFSSSEEFTDWIKSPEGKREVVAVQPLYLYDHSGISLSTGSFIGRAQHAEWDSGQVGYIYTTKAKLKEMGNKRSEVGKILTAEVETYNQYVQGDIYGYQIVKVGEEEEEADSCWGFYGSDECLKEAKSIVDGLVKK